MSTCNYEYHGEGHNFKCLEMINNREATRCMFHDEKYLEGDNYEKNKQVVVNRFNRKLSKYRSDNMHLLLMGYHLPEISFDYYQFAGSLYFSGVIFSGFTSFTEATFSSEAFFNRARFSKGVNFRKATFSKGATFSRVRFSELADFSETKFCGKAYFTGATFFNEANFSCEFNGEAYFNYVLFEDERKKIQFGQQEEVQDLSKFLFINTDITRIRFSDKIAFGGRDKFTIIEEKWLDDISKKGKNNIEKRRIVSLGGVLSVYRNLRENYEFRLQFDEAGKFFIREMEVKRKYRQIADVSASPSAFTIKENNRFRRNILSLIGWYHLLSNYGESLWRPTVAGFLIVFSFTFFFVTQSNPSLIPSFYTVFSNSSLIHLGTNNATHSSTNNIKNTKAAVAAAKPDTNYSKFVGLERVGNPTQWQKAFERAMGDFIPLLTLPSEIKVGVIDFVIKIIGGAITFGLLAIALRRKFERKYTR